MINNIAKIVRFQTHWSVTVDNDGQGILIYVNDFPFYLSCSMTGMVKVEGDKIAIISDGAENIAHAIILTIRKACQG